MSPYLSTTPQLCQTCGPKPRCKKKLLLGLRGSWGITEVQQGWGGGLCGDSREMYEDVGGCRGTGTEGYAKRCRAKGFVGARRCRGSGSVRAVGERFWPKGLKQRSSAEPVLSSVLV